MERLQAPSSYDNLSSKYIFRKTFLLLKAVWTFFADKSSGKHDNSNVTLTHITFETLKLMLILRRTIYK